MPRLRFFSAAIYTASFGSGRKKSPYFADLPCVRRKGLLLRADHISIIIPQKRPLRNKFRIFFV